MYTTLWNIKDELKALSTCLANLLGLEIAIYDKELCVVCTTTRAEDHYVEGKRVRGGYFASQILGSSRVAVNVNPGLNESCSQCKLWGNCPEKADMDCSINVGNSALGVIAFTAFDDTQKGMLIQRSNELGNTLKSIANLIAARITLENLHLETQLLHTKNEEICQMVSDGIVVVDSNGYVTNFNKVAEAIYGVSRNAILGKPLEGFFPDNPLVRILRGDLKEPDRDRVRVMQYNGQVLGAIEVIEHCKSMVKNEKARSDSVLAPEVKFTDIIGDSPEIVRIKNEASFVAKGDSNIFLQGESGTGKELFARAIHNNSFRRNGPFRAINCPSIPPTLLESELFGYEEGAFTGAGRGKPGKFEVANGGTLFLDEIGDILLELQPKLLRVLEERVIERVGGNKLIPINVRLITATNKDLESMVRQGKFREDLYYRINVIPLYLPPLRQRSEDILLIAQNLLAKYNKTFGKNVTGFTARAAEALSNYDWPGNIRELANCIEYVVNFETSTKVQATSLPRRVLDSTEQHDGPLSLKEYEKRYIQKTLNQYGQDYKGKLQAAQALGIDLTTLYRKMKQWQ